ncbi:cupin domain-containing protein [Rhizobium sp. CAU 1783]
MNIQTNIKAEDKLYWFGNTLIAIRLASASGVDGLSVIEHWMPYGEAPPLHVHHNEDEVFHILAGVMRFEVGGRQVVGHAGDTVLAPKGVPHAFRVESLAGARCLTLMRGTDFETMVREVSRSAPGPELPPSVAPTPAMINLLVAACARNHIDIIGAPLAC